MEFHIISQKEIATLHGFDSIFQFQRECSLHHQSYLGSHQPPPEMRMSP